METPESSQPTNEEVIARFKSDAALPPAVLENLCETLGIAGDLRLEFLCSIGIERVAAKFTEQQRGKHTDAKLIAEYEAFKRTRATEAEKMQYSERQKATVARLEKGGKRAFIRELKQGIENVYPYSIYPDPDYFSNKDGQQIQSLIAPFAVQPHGQ